MIAAVYFISAVVVVALFIALLRWLLTVRLRRNLKKGHLVHYFAGGVRYLGIVQRVYQNGHVSVYSVDTGHHHRLKSKKEITV